MAIPPRHFFCDSPLSEFLIFFSFCIPVRFLDLKNIIYMMTPFCYNYQNPSGFWKEGWCRFKPYWGFKFECKRKRNLIREVILIYLCNCNLPACLKRELHTMLLTMGGGCDCCRDRMWRREEKRWYTVHSSSRYKIRRRTLLRPCNKSPPPPPHPARSDRHSQNLPQIFCCAH